MATLRDVHSALFPTARNVGGATGPDRERADRDVGWVRVLKPRVPAFDALEPGDLAIIPAAALAVVASGPAQTEELARALAIARAPAVLLVEGDGDRAGLDALGEAAVAAGLTVLRLGRTDPVALERSIIGFLVNRRAELDRRAGDLERQLSALALLGRGLDAMAGAIGAFVGRAVVIEGVRGDPLAIHAPADEPTAAAVVARYHARPGEVALRVPIPAPAGEPSAGGRLVLLGEAPPNEVERVVADRIAALLALELARDAAVRQAREESRRGDPLPSDGPPWVVLLASQGPAPDVDASGRLAGREAVRTELRQLFSPRRVAMRGTSESLELRLVAAAPDDDPDGRAIADRLATFLGRTVALSRPFAEPGGRPAAEAAARATLEASEALHPAPPVVRVARLPAYRLLGNLHNLPDGVQQSRDLLAPVLTGGPATRRERLATLRAVLETGSIGEAAARLAVHRNTIAYRIARMERLGDWDLADPDLRVALGLAVRIMQDEQI